MTNVTTLVNPSPIEPDWQLTDEIEIATAREHWRSIVAEMALAGTLVAENGHAIRRLVEARMIYERASNQVLEHGAIVRAPKTKTPMHSPFWSVLLKAGQACDRMEAELGLAPTHRAKATKPADRKPRTPRPSDEYLPARR